MTEWLNEIWQSFEQELNAKIESMVYDYPWGDDELTPRNVYLKLQNELGEHGLTKFYHSMYCNNSQPFDTFVIVWATQVIEDCAS